MAARALIIAIEDYPKVSVGGIAKKLPGTLQAGLAFKQWLEAKWQAEGRAAGDTQLILCSEPQQRDGLGAAGRDIRRALLNLKEDGQNATEELYVFVSGHGFSFVQGLGRRADFVIASDFEDPNLSGEACLNLDEMVNWLRAHLGPGRHYYFVDACRNKLDGRRIRVSEVLTFDPQASGEASTFMLQSTVDGDVAAADGAFNAALLNGLRGQGKAKVWHRGVADRMFVRFDSLRGYLEDLLAEKQKISHMEEGSSRQTEAVLATLRPIPMSKCTITIEDVPAPLEGEVVTKRDRGGVEQRIPITNQPIELPVEPDDYTVSLRLRGTTVETSTPMPLDLYEDRALVFKPVAGDGLESFRPVSAGTTSSIEIVVPNESTVTLENVLTGETADFAASSRAGLPQGRYFAMLKNRRGQVFKRQEIRLEAGRVATLNVADWHASPPHVAIVSHLPPYAVQGEAVDFSESLGGAITDPDLDLWLALCGGGRILGPEGDYEKLAGLPLHDFSNEPPGASPIYVLAGFENPSVRLDVALSRDARVTWMPATQPSDMQGIREAYVAAAPGWHLMSFRIDGQAPYTVASLASPNRGMLLTLTLDEEDNPRVSQYLLPLKHLIDDLQSDLRELVQGRNRLHDLRVLAQATRAFRKRRDLQTEISHPELAELFKADWIDPIASPLAAYEARRRGRDGEMRKIATAMTRRFGDLPDTAALARMTGVAVARPDGVPLFLDGLRAFPDHAHWLPLPTSHLDFTSPWTAWRAAINT